MPRRKKQAHELTTDEALKKLFPKKAREEAKLVAQNARKLPTKPSTKGKPS